MTQGTIATRPAIDQVWAWLREISDPEIPAISIVDLGIVREITWSGGENDPCLVAITPTYSGCPANEVIRNQVRETLKQHGVRDLRIEIRLSPPWTTDWLTPQGRDALRAFGIAPPAAQAADAAARTLPIAGALPILDQILDQLFSHADREKPACPRCGSADTERISQFGSTLCKALYRCRRCLEPFDYFKCH